MRIFFSRPLTSKGLSGMRLVKQYFSRHMPASLTSAPRASAPHSTTTAAAAAAAAAEVPPKIIREAYPPYGLPGEGRSSDDNILFRARQTISEFKQKWGHIEGGARVTHDSNGKEVEVTLAGRVISKRVASKKLMFLDIESNGEQLQVMANESHFIVENSTEKIPAKECDEGHTGKFSDFRSCMHVLQRGDVIGITGFPARSQIGELSIIPRSMHFLSPCMHDIPAPGDSIVTDPDIRFRNRAMDLLSNPASRETLSKRFRAISSLRSFLEERHFVEVETPILSFSAGGAAAESFVTKSKALGRKAGALHMRIAPELYLKQLVIGGFDRVFEIGKVFRNEGIDSTHNPEFTTCEFYAAYMEYQEMMSLTEELLRHVEGQVSSDIHEKSRDGDHLDRPVLFGNTGDAAFRRISVYDELEKILGDQKLPPADELSDPHAAKVLLNLCGKNPSLPALPEGTPKSAAKILDHMIGHLIEPFCTEPTFLCDHPVVMSPLAKEHRDRPGLTERFELFVRGRELCNAYTELNDPKVQRIRFEQQQKDMVEHDDVECQVKDETFCEALEYGLPPTAGWGIGVDRLVMLLTGHTHIREVLPFALMKPK